MESINSIVLTKISKYKKESINEIFEDLNKNFTKGYIYIFVEDLKTNTLIDAYKYEISDSNLESLNKFKEKIQEKLLYFYNKKYENKYLLHIYFINKNKKLIKSLFPNKINRIYKKVSNYYNFFNELNNFEKFLIQLANFSLTHPIKIISGFITIVLLYILIVMYSKGLKPEEIDMSTLSLTIELFIALIGFFISIYLITLFLPFKLTGINLKTILGVFFILLLLIMSLVIFDNKNQKPLIDSIIEQYLIFKKYPRFATLVIWNKNNKIEKPVLLRFISNRYIYYNNLCDTNINEINLSKLSVLDFLNKVKNNSLLSISTSNVNEIINTHFSIKTNYLRKICSSKKNKK